MNKHALFLYGDYRTFDWCHIWYANKIPDNVDVYISTYNTSWEQKINEIQFNKKDGTWDFIELSPPPRPHVKFPNKSEYSITHFTEHIEKSIFENVFKDNLNDVHITSRDFNQWILGKETVGTTSFIIKHLQKIVENIPIEKQKEYRNIYILRLDCVPVVGGNDEVFTFDDKLFDTQFDLQDDTLYSQSEEDMEDWSFAQDLVFSGRAKTIIDWIKYLDSDKHPSPHTSIASATGEMVKKGILKHKKLFGYNSHIIRRSLIPFFSYYWDKGIWPLRYSKSRGIWDKFHTVANKLEHRLYYK